MDLNKTFKIRAYGLDIDELVRALYYQGVPNIGIDVEPDRSGFWMVVFNPSFQQLQVIDIIFDIIERDYQSNISELIAAPASPKQVYDFPMPQTLNSVPQPNSYQLPKYISSPQGQGITMLPHSNTPYSVIPFKPVLGQIQPPANIQFFVPFV